MAGRLEQQDRKSTRLNSSHDQISYAVFCLKKKNERTEDRSPWQTLRRRREPPPRPAHCRSTQPRPRPHAVAPAPFFFNDPATTEIYPLSLHDALPIQLLAGDATTPAAQITVAASSRRSPSMTPDRKSTRLNSSHDQISYAVFCWK